MSDWYVSSDKDGKDKKTVKDLLESNSDIYLFTADGSRYGDKPVATYRRVKYFKDKFKGKENTILFNIWVIKGNGVKEFWDKDTNSLQYYNNTESPYVFEKENDLNDEEDESVWKNTDGTAETRNVYEKFRDEFRNSMLENNKNSTLRSGGGKKSKKSKKTKRVTKKQRNTRKHK